jgi:4-alpha-glucanotransferase
MALRQYAAEHEVAIIGDIPIFMAIDNCDVWADRKLFRLDSKGYPLEVAGVPPDYFSATGQLWGNPLYDWGYHEKTGYEWWIRRLQRQLELVDYVRIDHFRGFVSYWAVPADAETAIEGEWKEGPGEKLFLAMQKKFGEDLPIIAEDLGLITEDVEQLRDQFGFPGMKVLQFGFENMNDNKYIPHFYDTPNCVCYTGTHDNDTTVGWYQHQGEEVKDRVRLMGNCDGNGVSLDFIRFAMSSVAKFSIFPIQDLLQLGNEARMNTPGVAADNWAFRYEQKDIDEAWRRDWLKRYTKVYDRSL